MCLNIQWFQRDINHNMSVQPAADDQAELAVVDVVQKEVCVERMRWMKRIMNEEEFEFELHEDIMIENR